MIDSGVRDTGIEDCAGSHLHDLPQAIGLDTRDPNRSNLFKVMVR